MIFLGNSFPMSNRPVHRLIGASYIILSLLCILPLAAVALADDSVPAPGTPPGSYRILSDDGQIRIPFELYRGDIRMIGQMNGREVRMMIDNGHMWDQILFFGSPRVDSLGMESVSEIEVGGSGDGDPIMSTLAEGVTISFPGVEFYDQTAIITPYSSGVANMWSGTEGQVSATFLMHFVVEVNFDDMVMTLTEPDKFKYTGGGVELPMKHLGGGAWAVPATMELANGQVVPLDMWMDLGYGEQLEIHPGGPSKVTVPERSLPGSLGFGIQGETLGRFGRVKSVDLGGYKLTDVVAGFVSGEYDDSNTHDVMVGLGLLSRFNFIYDYPGGRMFVEPNHTFSDPFDYNMSGMATRRGQGDYLEVRRVHPDSPAEEAGLTVGDKIKLINGRRAVDYDVWELIPLLRQTGNTVKLVLIRDNEETAVSLVLRPLI